MATQHVAMEYDPQPLISSVARSLLSGSCRSQREISHAKTRLAQLLGIDKVTLNAKLRDDRRWTIEEVAGLARYFGRPIEDFYQGDDPTFRKAVSSDRRLPRPDSNREPAGNYSPSQNSQKLQQRVLQAA
jgi:DNA-binding XRE family transcriptional regulator